MTTEKKSSFGKSYAEYHLNRYGTHKKRLTQEQLRKRKATKAQGKARKLNRV